jgi:putative transposase
MSPIQGRTRDTTVTAGSRWRVGEEVVIVIGITAIDAVLVEDGRGNRRSMRPGELRPIDDGLEATDPVVALEQEDSSAWQKARQIESDIDQLARVDPVSDEAVRSLALRWNVSRATVWRRIDRYRQQGDLSALISKRPGLKTGASLLPASAEVVIREIAKHFWHQTENAPLSDIVPAVKPPGTRQGEPICGRQHNGVD